MQRDGEHYEEIPRWRLLMYPIGGMVGTALLFGAWIVLADPPRRSMAETCIPCSQGLDVAPADHSRH